jgi:nucleotide-binding universal stress UspA family protein
MKLRDILVVLDAGAASEGRLKLATNIARDHRAHLDATFLPPDDEAADFPPGLGVPRRGLIASPPVSNVIDISRSAMLTGATEDRFRDHLRLSRIEGKWHLLDRANMAELISLAQAADLIILGQINPDARSAPALRPEKIVVACGRPALLVPYVGTYAQVGRRVLIAWDGSREAGRALNDALPLIGNAEAVTVMTVRARERDFEGDRPSIERIIRHLARHGVVARSDEVLRGGNAISDVLLSRAADIATDLIVAGAYHHSQVREALIGGVSRGLFQHMTVPVLMSH